MLLSLLFGTTAHAFCGTYVGSPGATLYNHESKLVYVRENNQNTLTLVNDYSGDLTDFALLIPVPQVLSRDDVSTVEPSVINEIDAYSAPRLVSYTCENVSQPTAMSCGGEAPASHSTFSFGEDETKGVTVEARFDVGAYDVVILSSTQSGALLGWLDENGYGVSPDAETLLQESIDSGSYFLAARVSLEQLPPDTTFLSPLRISYRSNAMTLPLRLGTLNSDGVQDFTLFVVNDMSLGEAAISNYPELTLEDDCMLQEGEDLDFDATWTQKVDEAFGDEAGWISEYVWLAGSCDPCPETGALSEDALRAVGYEGDANRAQLTRLHMRYRPEQITTDLVLYSTGILSMDQVRYIVYLQELESSFPICGVGMVDPSVAGTCGDDTLNDPTARTAADTAASSGGCSSAVRPGAWGWISLVFAGLALARRR